MGILTRGKNYLKQVRSGISNLEYIRNNQSRMYEISQYNALLSDSQVSDYFKEVRDLMTVKDVRGGTYVRVGDANGSGGYIMLDDVRNKDIFYSFGISTDVTWDSWPAERWNKPVYMYDHTIDRLPYEHNNFRWERIGICGENDIGKNKNLKSLSELLKVNGHCDNEDMILKMDVEGAEWDVLSTFPADELDRFDQITLEMHWFLDLNNRGKIIESLKNLNKYHQIVHIHGNCFSLSIPMDGYNMPNIMEATYVRKRNREFVKSERFFPTPLDRKNDWSYPEIMMGFWN